jgi:polyhydroxybutyrate depolymerase
MRSIALAVLVVTACGGDDATPTERPTTFGGARPVSLQVPTDFDDSRDYPLFVILHGYGANSFLQQGYFKLSDGANRLQALVLTPDGTLDSGGKQFWNADPACCDFGGSGVDDVAYLGGVIDAVRAEWPVDPAQIAILGHSNGAFMAYRLACDRADVVTAIIGLAGHATSTPCTPSRDVNVLHIHGTADATVPYTTGVFGGVMSPGATDSVDGWAQHNGCTGARQDAGTKDLDAAQAGAESTVAVTAGCPIDGAADLWTIPDGGHIPSLSATFPDDAWAWVTAHRRP